MTLPKDVTTPLFFYLAVTIGVPLCGGSANGPDFRAHAATVIAVSAALVVARTLASVRLTKPAPDTID